MTIPESVISLHTHTHTYNNIAKMSTLYINCCSLEPHWSASLRSFSWRLLVCNTSAESLNQHCESIICVWSQWVDVFKSNHFFIFTAQDHRWQFASRGFGVFTSTTNDFFSSVLHWIILEWVKYNWEIWWWDTQVLTVPLLLISLWKVIKNILTGH